MALLRRIKQSDIRFLSNQFLRSYFQIHSPCRASYSYNKSLILNYKSLPIKKCQFEFPSSVRFFAAPVQAKPKNEGKDSGPRLNEQITADVVRLVTEEGHFVLPKQEALRRARNLKLDLVEVQRDAKPPVCKIMDYHREKYQRELKEKDRAKSKSEGTLRNGACKEIRFSGNITQKDLQIKVDTAKRLMERGYRVKCQAKGNKNKDGEGEDSAALLSRFLALSEDFAVVESDTRVEDKDQAHIIVRHSKYGPTKKSVKKGSGGNKSVTAKRDGDSEESEQSGWKVDDANDDFDKIFELDSPGGAMNLSNEKTPFAVESSSSSGVSSGYASPLRGLDSASRPATSSTPIGGRENRYMKDPRNSSRRRSPPDASNYSERENAQFNANSSPKQRETEYRENQSSTFRNMEHREQAPFSVPSSPTPSHGMFSQVDNATGKRNLPAESNRYKQRNPSDTGGHTGRRVGATVSPRF